MRYFLNFFNSIISIWGCIVLMFIGVLALGIHSSNIMQDYQVRLGKDSLYVFDKGELVGSCRYGKDGIDSVILKDNQ